MRYNSSIRSDYLIPRVLDTDRTPRPECEDEPSTTNFLDQALSGRTNMNLMRKQMELSASGKSHVPTDLIYDIYDIENCNETLISYLKAWLQYSGDNIF
uniref:Neur_chan_LBD domain-containing protein n=1 Tax=Heterorhabditis bacteriophora TaxID=37862 RepID=A0A1I7X2T7_HETBA